MKHSEIARIVANNTWLLDEYVSGYKSITPVKNGDEWGLAKKVWVPGTFRNEDEYDDDINRGSFERRPIKGFSTDDVHAAMDAKEEFVSFIESAQERRYPIEYVLEAQYSDDFDDDF